ncbi:MAG TPA: hypothetical protein PLX23_12725, partial [Candidatus Hydrogenedens sp.]|nr:hypothetical protein [Candidatus Hydrogenedens sp.]
MSYLFLSIVILSSNFGAQDFYGEVPENIPTFLIKTQREQSEFYGGIIIQNQWLNDTSIPELKNKAVEIVVDTPWETPQLHRRELGHRIEISYEAPVLRKKRLEEGWKKAGYVILDTPNGKRVIKDTVYKQALQAIDMAQSIYKQNQPPELLYSPSKVELSTEFTRTNFLKMWIFHIIVVIIG